MAPPAKATVPFLLNTESNPTHWDIVLGRSEVREEENSSKLVCPVCSKRFGQSSNLNKHRNVVHLKLRPWPCKYEHCSKTFAQRCVAQKHYDTVHLGKRPFECKVCGKAFADPSNRKKHVRLVHQKEKKYGCEICAKRFGEKRSLTNHVREKHTYRGRSDPRKGA